MNNQHKSMVEQIADYAFLGKTQRSWKVWTGNPLCIMCETIPLKEYTKDQIIKVIKKAQLKEKKRFTKHFPDIEWTTAKIDDFNFNT